MRGFWTTTWRSIMVLALLVGSGQAVAQSVATDTAKTAVVAHGDTLQPLTAQELDSILDAPKAVEKISRKDRKALEKQARAEQSLKPFVPNPKRALWLALVIPGGGQIYNRKYWKLPIIYGGFLGCTYALIWNQQMYSDYSQAYLDIMDSDPNTKSYMDFLPPNYDVASRENYLKEVFKRRKDYYRRYRDMSIIAFGAVYALSVIDAYVDAELSVFDISPNLSMSVRPAVINSNHALMPSSTMGVGCALRF